MALQKKDREFRLTKITYLDFKMIEMDRVLTGLFERLEHGGYPSVFRDKRELTVEQFVDEILAEKEKFVGFSDHRDIVVRWVETHLMDIVNRGRANQVVAGPRPLHGYTYRFRNPKHSRDYGAAQHQYHRGPPDRDHHHCECRDDDHEPSCACPTGANSRHRRLDRRGDRRGRSAMGGGESRVRTGRVVHRLRMRASDGWVPRVPRQRTRCRYCDGLLPDD